MNIAFYILTYNRPKILQRSISTLFSNTSIKPNESWIIDDGSNPDLQSAILKLGQDNKINLLLSTRNYGVGYSFERLYNLIYQNDDVDVACIIESDYIWRKGWLEDVVATFEASPHTLAVAGTDHPDMYDREKTHTVFPEIMREQFYVDLSSRQNLYKPFDLETSRGKIKVQGVSNSCGCLMLHWKRMKAVIHTLEDEGIVQHRDYKRRMDRAFNKGITHDTRRNAADGHMSGIISMYGEKYLTYRHIDKTKNFPFLSICDFSIAEHIAGDGLNGKIVPEGHKFMASPTWSDEYLLKDPRA